METPMRIRLFFTSMLAALMSFTVQAYAGKFVEFESGAGKSNQTRIIGYLARPQGSGPFPAVVVLHGCGGFHEDMLAWADRLRRWGYVALAVDSFGPRGIETACGSFGEKGSISELFPDKFRAGVALYPPCNGSSGVTAAPTLVLIGALDDWTPASACEAMAAGRSELGISRSPGDRSLVQLIIYPDAHHGFDLAGLRFTNGIKFSGHRLEYNDAVTRDSIEKVRGFFRQTLSHE